MTDSNTAGPLAGIRVLEFGQIAAGPFTGSLLADLGADVVKVERPDGGDGMRDWPPLTGGAGDAPFSENFASLTRN
jgi:crotonobetainyl-CoA:carnitine CoA-transferase CaiB-like acyl-CoA transferase